MFWICPFSFFFFFILAVFLSCNGCSPKKSNIKININFPINTTTTIINNNININNMLNATTTTTRTHSHTHARTNCANGNFDLILGPNFVFFLYSHTLLHPHTNCVLSCVRDNHHSNYGMIVKRMLATTVAIVVFSVICTTTTTMDWTNATDPINYHQNCLPSRRSTNECGAILQCHTKS